jgi:hypothetical protein
MRHFGLGRSTISQNLFSWFYEEKRTALDLKLPTQDLALHTWTFGVRNWRMERR